MFTNHVVYYSVWIEKKKGLFRYLMTMTKVGCIGFGGGNIYVIMYTSFA